MAKGTHHRVRDGEDLLFLAEWYYGDSMAHSHIYWANLEVYGDDFEMIPGGSPIFIPDIETSDTVESYTGPAVPERRDKQYPVRMGPTKGGFRVEREESGMKTLILTFEGERQEAE
jgi:hypothetical protein